MAVQEQTPIIEYISNGSTNIFPITFDIHTTEDLGVLINGELASEASYEVQDNSVVFMVMPPSGSTVTLFRDTEKKRLTDYKSYDNSFRPSAINWDLDKLWHVLQEQNLVDAKILARLKTEIEWRRTHDFNYDELAQVREKQIFDSLLGYSNTLFASTTPNVFEGVTAGVVFALDKKSVQTHLNEIAANLEEIRLNLLNAEENSSQAIASEESRAIGAEENLNSKITNESSRAQAAEDSLLIQLNAIGVGNKAYKTYALMDADKASIPAKSKVTVTNDATASNNGDWQWDGVVFTKSAYDPPTQAKKYTDTSINNIFSNDINIADLSKSTAGYYVSYSDGVIAVNAASSVLGAYEIIPSTLYQVPADYSQQFAFYDENMVYISGLASADSNHQFTTPSNAKYIKLSVPNSQLARFMLCKASEYPPTYTPFAVKKKALKVDLDQVVWPESEFDLTVQKIAHLHDINLVNVDKVLDSHYVSYSTGEVFPNSAFVATDFIKIQGVTEYQNTAGNNQQLAFYDENKVHISGLATTEPTNKFITPSDAKYIRLTIQKTLLDIFMLTKSEDFSDEYIPFDVKSLKNVRVESSNSNADSSIAMPIFQPVLKAVSSNLTVNLSGTVIKQMSKSTVLNSSFTLDATATSTAIKESTLVKSAATVWISNPNEFLGFCNISNVVVTNKADNSTLINGTHYEVDSFGGKLIGLTDTVYNVSVSFTHTMQRYDLIQINPFTLAVSLKKGVERTQDPSEWMVEVDPPCRALCRVLVTGNKTEIIPLSEYIACGGKPYVSKLEFDALRLHNQACLKRIFAKLNKGQNISLVGYGDSITAMGGFHTEDIPNENHDWYGFFATLPQDTQTAKVPTFNYEGGGGGRMHTGWNWKLKEFLESTYSNTVTYWNYGVSGTDSTIGARDQRLAYPLSKNPDLVVVAFGMNDAGSSALYTNLVKIVNTFKNAGADVVLMPVVRTPTLPYVGYQGEAWRQVNRFVYSAAIDSGAAYCPIDWYADDTHFGGMGISSKHFCTQNMLNHPGPYEYSIYGKILVSIFE